MSNRRPTLLLALLLVAACASTDRDPIVVDSDAPDVSRKESGPATAEPNGEVSLLDPNRVVARVNDQVITVRTLNAKYGANFRRLGEVGEAQVRYMLDQYSLGYITQVIVFEAARSFGVAVTDEEFRQKIERVEKGLLARDTTLEEDLEAQGLARWEWEAQLRREMLTKKLREMLLGTSAPVSAETRAIVDIWVRPVDVQNAYERRREEYRVEERARVEAIYLVLSALRKEGESGLAVQTRVRELANEIVAKARAGEDFAELTKPYHEPGQYLAAPFGRGEKQPPVDEFVWDEKTAVGDVSDPIVLRGSVLILKLVSRQDAGYLPFEEVRDAIEQELQLSAVHLAQARVQLQLLEEAVITPRRYKVALIDSYRRAIRAELEKQAR
ncbi:MAG: peptidyl-prolyl cis-trans isomerase [Planctomycetota bacterium]